MPFEATVCRSRQPLLRSICDQTPLGWYSIAGIQSVPEGLVLVTDVRKPAS